MTGAPTSGGRVVLVGTPIGNLGDLSQRAAEVLGAADVVACEDTRRTGRLLAHLGIRAPSLVRLDEHTERQRADELVGRALGGATVAVVSDAGMPGLSDPGGVIVDVAVAADVPVEVVPGPFAAAVGLVGSGLVGDGRFVFEGFLPRKGADRDRRLRALAAFDRPVVLYEAPHRVARTLEDLAAVVGPDRRVALCRELTKLHEATWRGTLAGALDHLAAAAPRGEYVVVLDAAPPAPAPQDDELRAELDELLTAGLSRRDAAERVATARGVPRNRVKGLMNRPEGA